ncbi:MAG: hypothetical protein AB8B96_17030 [Lysobacterales bacterium]
MMRSNTLISLLIAGLVWTASSEGQQLFDLRDLDGNNGFRFIGLEPSGQLGARVQGAGDVNGDGLNDIVIDRLGGDDTIGEFIVVYGSTQPFPAQMNPNNLTMENGAKIVGAINARSLGGGGLGAGDFNGDGIDDLVLGSPGPPGSDGEAFVVYGISDQTTFPFDLRFLNVNQGFRLRSLFPGDRLGYSVGSGDFNGDGLSDVVLGAPEGSSDQGIASVVFGTTQRPQTLDLIGLESPAGFNLVGPRRFGSVGLTVNSAGDFNNDGIEDVFVAGDTEFTQGGRYLIYGQPTDQSSDILLANLNANRGVEIGDANNRSDLGTAASHGDINGDGIDDLIITDPGPNSSGGSGAAHVIFGTSEPLPPGFDPTTLNGTNGFTVAGVEGERLGTYVSGNGDVNGDGIDDLLIDTQNTAELFVVFGRRDLFSAIQPTSTLVGNNGFKITGFSAFNSIFSSVDIVGDINGDSIDDFVIGDPWSSNDGVRVGQAYVVFGNAPPRRLEAQQSIGNGLEGAGSIESSVVDALAATYVDRDPMAGAAIVGGSNATQAGSWEYATGNGMWQPVPNNLSDSNAIVLGNTDTLRFVPNSDFSGSSPPLFVRLWDGAWAFPGSDSDIRQAINAFGGFSNNDNIVTIFATVDDINDRPTFVAQDPPATIENSGTIRVNPWAQFDPGSPFESTQTATYEVTNWDVSLLAEIPEISPTGTLVYTLLPDTQGTGSIEVRVVDSGGQVNGGLNASLPQVFFITVVDESDRLFIDSFE